MAKITIVGCGPGSPDYLTPLASQSVKKADVLVGSKRLLALFAENGEERISVGASVEKVLGEIADLDETRSITVLVSGDAGLHSLAKPVIERFGRDNCTVVPGVSSVQVAFARIGLDWFDAKIISAHEVNPDINADSLSGFGKIAVLGGRDESLLWIADLAESLGDERIFYVCENLTLPDENVRAVKADELKLIKASSLVIVLLIRKKLLK